MVLVLFAIVSVVSAHQQHVKILRYLDSDEYYWMAYKFHINVPVDQSAPWVYRIATPWLASFATANQIASGTPFFAINLASSLLIALLLVTLLRNFIASPAVRIIVIVLFLTEWHAPTRFIYYHPMYVDPLFMLFLLMGCIVIDRTRHLPLRLAAPPLMLISLLGTLDRESMIVLPVAFVIARMRTCRESGRLRAIALGWLAAPLGVSVAALWFTHRIGIASEPYSPMAIPRQMLREKPLFTWVLGWCFTFGPSVVALVIADARRAVQLLRDRPDFAFLLGMVGVLGYVAGTDTERILIWSFPVVYVLAGRAIERYALQLVNVRLAALLISAQAVSARIFWSIPSPSYNPEPFTSLPSMRDQAYTALNRIVVVDNEAGNLWSFWGSRRWHAILFVYDVVFVIAMTYWIRRTAHPSSERMLTKL